MRKFLLPITEYNRVYQVAHGILRDIAEVRKACMFFASFGAYVLNKHYKIAARPVAGSFAICIGDGPDVASFGSLAGGTISSGQEGFHMWVQTQTHILDFMAPIYPEAFAEHAAHLRDG